MPNLDIIVNVEGGDKTTTIPEVCVNRLQELREQYPDLNLQFEPPHEIPDYASRSTFVWCRVDVEGESYYQGVYGTPGWDDPVAALNMLEEAMYCLLNWARAKRNFNPDVWDKADLIRLGKKKGQEDG